MSKKYSDIIGLSAKIFHGMRSSGYPVVTQIALLFLDKEGKYMLYGVYPDVKSIPKIKSEVIYELREAYEDSNNNSGSLELFLNMDQTVSHGFNTWPMSSFIPCVK